MECEEIQTLMRSGSQFTVKIAFFGDVTHKNTHYYSFMLIIASNEEKSRKSSTITTLFVKKYNEMNGRLDFRPKYVYK